MSPWKYWQVLQCTQLCTAGLIHSLIQKLPPKTTEKNNYALQQFGENGFSTFTLKFTDTSQKAIPAEVKQAVIQPFQGRTDVSRNIDIISLVIIMDPQRSLCNSTCLQCSLRLSFFSMAVTCGVSNHLHHQPIIRGHHSNKSYLEWIYQNTEVGEILVQSHLCQCETMMQRPGKAQQFQELGY